jgi:hypothetical protein
MKIFIDDFRDPKDCLKYMHERIGPDNVIYDADDWRIIRNYPEFEEYLYFVRYMDLWNTIEVISFDHDLADGHYHKSMQRGKINYGADSFMDRYNRTGYHCAELLIENCMDYGLKLPPYLVHSMNPVGAANIKGLLDNYKQHG